MSKSIMQDRKECYMCRNLYGDQIELTSEGLEEHHVFPGTANRAKSEQYGLKVWLCSEHHRHGELAVHRNKDAMRMLKMDGERAFKRLYCEELWMEEFGKEVL